MFGAVESKLEVVAGGRGRGAGADQLKQPAGIFLLENSKRGLLACFAFHTVYLGIPTRNLQQTGALRIPTVGIQKLH